MDFMNFGDMFAENYIVLLEWFTPNFNLQYSMFLKDI
jgi:hypothetical protein